METSVLIFSVIIFVIIFLVMVLITRWIFGIDTITSQLKKQTKILAEMAKRQDINPSVINNILKED